MLKTLCQKFQERSTLKSIVIRSAASLFFHVTWLKGQKSLLKSLKNGRSLHEKQHISSQQCDDSKS